MWRAQSLTRVQSKFRLDQRMSERYDEHFITIAFRERFVLLTRWYRVYVIPSAHFSSKWKFRFNNSIHICCYYQYTSVISINSSQSINTSLDYIIFYADTCRITQKYVEYAEICSKKKISFCDSTNEIIQLSTLFFNYKGLYIEIFTTEN